MSTLITSFFGGPGTGKSTTCAGVFHQLKLAGVNCEMALEYAKDRVWEGSEQVLDNQLYVFGKQYHRMWRLLGKVDVILTDAPLLNSILFYSGESQHFPRMVFEEHQKLANFNVFLHRVKPYNPAGRLQDEQAAKELDARILGILDHLGQDYFSAPAISTSVDVITNMALTRWQKLKAV